jgi:hypothetical protein
MNQNAEVFGAILKALTPSRRDLILSAILSVTVLCLAIFGLLHLLGAV